MKSLNTGKTFCTMYHRCDATGLQSHSNLYPLRYEIYRIMMV